MFQHAIRLIALSLLFSNYHSFGQYSNYVSRFSQPGIYGTARMQALGGAGVALGADLSSAGMNPGGLGMYNKSDIGASIGIGSATTNSSYTTLMQTGDSRDSRAWFSIPNLGMSFYNESRNPNSAFKGGSFAITYNKTANFQNEIGYAGISDSLSMIDDFVEEINRDPNAQSNINNDQFTSGPVQTPSAFYYYSNLIAGTQGNFGSNYPYPSSVSPFQNQGSATTRKGQYHWDIAYGANFLNRIYVGASLGISVLNYRLLTRHQEVVNYNPASPNNLISFEFEEEDQHRATGVNLKIGGIFKVTDQFRIAATVLTPTSQMVKESYVWNINTKYNTATGYVNSDLELVKSDYRYRYIAPPRFEAGATYVFNKAGLVTAGVEYVPYAWATMNDPNSRSVSRAYNKAIKDSYRNPINAKVGLELRDGIYYYRFGGAYIADPYKEAFDNINRDQWNITAGWGVRTSTFYFDIAAVNTRFNGIYKPYTFDNVDTPTAAYKSSIVQFTMTAGILY